MCGVPCGDRVGCMRCVVALRTSDDAGREDRKQRHPDTRRTARGEPANREPADRPIPAGTNSETVVGGSVLASAILIIKTAVSGKAGRAEPTRALLLTTLTLHSTAVRRHANAFLNLSVPYDILI